MRTDEETTLKARGERRNAIDTMIGRHGVEPWLRR
jgi:hypothetical protein